MSRKHFASLALLLVFAATPAGLAQFPKLITDFESGSWVDFVDVVMFNNPSFSTSSRGLDPVTGDSTYLTNVTIDTFSRAHSGIRSSATFFGWLHANDPSSWVRLTTFNTQHLPNPALHLGGKVRVWVAATAYTDASFATSVPNGTLYLGLGLRETGQGVPKGFDGGIAGQVEWVGLDAVLGQIFAGDNGVCDTTADPNSDDVQLVASGSPAGPGVVCIDAGPDGVLQTAAADDDFAATTPRGRFAIPSDGVMRLYEFDLPAEIGAGNVYAFVGDGVLAATPNNRGTLDHVALTNHPGNAAVNANVWLVNIDDVTFESPIIDPPLIVVDPNPPAPLDEQVDVEVIEDGASLLEIVRLLPQGGETLLGSVANPSDPFDTVTTDPLAAGIRIAARQTIGPNVSDNSTPVIVASPGNGPLRIAMAIRETDAYDHALACGADGTGFDPDAPSTLEFIGSGPQQGFGVPTPPRFTTQPDWFEVTFNPCDPDFGVTLFSGNGELDLNPAPDHTMGVWEGLYFRIDEQSPTPGPYTVFIDDMTVKDQSGAVVCVVDDFESYVPGTFIVGDFNGNGLADTLADPGSDDIQIVPVGGAIFAGQIIVDPGPDGVLQTVAQGDDGVSTLHARFNFPSAAGTSVGLDGSPDLTRVTDEQAFSGSQSLEVQWAFVDASNLSSVLRLTTNGSTATNPPETFLNPDSVIPFSLDGTLCDGDGDLYYSVMIRLAPPEVPADCDGDGDVDMHDLVCLQECFGESPISQDCATFDIAPNGAPDGALNFGDYDLFNFLHVGPSQ